LLWTKLSLIRRLMKDVSGSRKPRRLRLELVPRVLGAADVSFYGECG
jgi:hypothetical protein